MLFDTDILIWVQRGNLKAARLIDTSPERFLSVYSYMELLQTAKNSQQHHTLKNFLSTFGFLILPLTEAIGHSALEARLHMCKAARFSLPSIEMGPEAAPGHEPERRAARSLKLKQRGGTARTIQV